MITRNSKMISYYCKTPIHLFRAIQIQKTINKDFCADIYVFDTFAESYTISERLKRTKVFINVYFIKDSETFYRGFLGSLRSIYKKSSLKEILENSYYDELFFFNIYSMANDLVYNIQKKKNQHIVVNMVEDAPSIYHIDKNVTKTQKIIYPIMRLLNPIDHIDVWWFSRPEMMSPFGHGCKRTLPMINKKNNDFLDIINYVFNYHKNEMLENADVIIMEECYWNDGLLKNGEDYNLFLKLKEQFPHLKICVKLHPRTRKNRFKNTFDTVPANGIPWEVYALNMDMNSKIVVSLSCTTMVSPKLMYGDETYSLLLYPILREMIIDKETQKPYLTKQRIEKIQGQTAFYSNKNKFQIANDFNTSILILKEWIEEKMKKEAGRNSNENSCYCTNEIE